MFRQVRSLIDEWFSPLTQACVTVDRQGILDRLSEGKPIDFYKPEGVWLEEASFNTALQQLQLVCRIPEPHYLKGDDAMDHVSAEQLIRCYAQACYLLGILLRESNSSFFPPNQSVRSRAFFYAGTEVRYRRPEPTGKPISFTLALDKAVRVGENTAYYFRIVGGSMTGRVMCFYTPSGSAQELPATLYDQLYFLWKSAWAELPKFQLNAMRLISRLYGRHQLQPLTVPITA